MRLLVLGASGGTGRQVVTQGLQQGHTVTALVRHPPERLGITHDRLRVITGSVTDDDQALADAVADQEAVISALGAGTSLKSGGLIAASVPRILAAMETHGVRRLLFTSAYGVGDTRVDLPLVPRILIGLLLRDIYADKTAGEVPLRRSRLDWTLVYPVTLTNGPHTGQYRVGEHLALRGVPRVSRADVADFLLSQIEDRRFLKQGVLISA